MFNINYFSEDLLGLFLETVPKSYREGFVKQIKANRFNVCFVKEKVSDQEFLEEAKTFRIESSQKGSLILDSILSGECNKYFKSFSYKKWLESKAWAHCITIIIKEALKAEEIKAINFLVKNYVKYGRLILIYHKTANDLKKMFIGDV